jgi:hypothetical protein
MAVADPWALWSADRIAAATGCPVANVREHWPRIWEQMGHCGIQTPNVAVGMIGTTAIEGASTFAPVREGCYLGEPEPAETHRKTLPYYPFYGRGHIQLTHDGNYRAYGPKVASLWGANPSDPSFDLIGHPDHALDPDLAAAVIALYFRDTRARPSASYPEGYTLIQACEGHDWEWVRRLVYGGADPSGSQRIAQIEADLGPPGVPQMPKVTFNYNEPAHLQEDSFDCSQESLEWGLYAVGRAPAENWLEPTMIAEGVMSPELGLLDHTGAGLADFVRRHYGSGETPRDIFDANNTCPISWDDLVPEIDPHPPYPVLLGLPNWGGPGLGHWAGIRGFSPGGIVLANPATGATYGQTILMREQFERMAGGNASIVRILHPDLTTSEPAPPPPAPAPPLAAWKQEGLDMLHADDQAFREKIRAWIDRIPMDS